MSFAPEDKARMTNDFMVQLAKEYMMEMGIKEIQYIIVRHHNTDNEHLHIVYNRIDNNLKLISVNNDYKRNVKTCKKLKDKYNLTYGEGKDRVRREKLRNPDKVKSYIYDTIKTALSHCKNEKDLQLFLRKAGVETEFKLKRTTGEVERISFRYDGIAFKGSQIDRKFSFGNLKKEFERNIKVWQEQAIRDRKRQGIQPDKAEKPTGSRPQTHIIGEMKLTLEEGGFIYLENMKKKDGGGEFSSYVFLNDEKNRAFPSDKNPDEFVKYGKYEVRIRDKILIEHGYVTHCKVKWYGYENYVYPYLWKESKADIHYKESWSDPRSKEESIQKEENKKQKPKMNRGKGNGSNKIRNN